MEHPDAIERYGLDHPDAYAGSHLRGATIVTRWTGDPDEHLPSLRRLTASAVSAEPAGFSLATLVALRDRVQADDAALARDGIGIDTLGIDPVANRLVLDGDGIGPAGRRRLADRYGPALLVR